MEFNGLPLHALVIHGAVVFGPLASVLALGYLLPPLREQMRWPLAVTAVLAAVFVTLAYLSGNDLLDRNPALGQIPAVETHEHRAVWALVATLVLVVVVLAALLTHRRGGPVRILLDVLLGAAAVATIVAVVLTGDAGAQAMWGGL